MYTFLLFLNVASPIAIVVLFVKLHDMKRDFQDLVKELETLKKSSQ